MDAAISCDVFRLHGGKVETARSVFPTKTLERALLIVHTARGKGKSSAAFGMALRGLGWGMRGVRRSEAPVQGGFQGAERRRILMRAIAFAALVLATVAARAAPLPRIVSINPCVDAVLVHVAQPEQILGISHYSQDPRATSIPLDLARRFHATSGTAEEVVALAPDLVMSGPHVSPSTIFALERMNIRIVKFTVPESVAESEQQVRQIAAAAGSPAKGEVIVGMMEHAIERGRPHGERALRAVIWQGGGVVPGRGTLADELLRLTGYRNLSAAYGLAKWDVLPLEYLIAAPPDVVLSVGTGAAERDRMLGHPAVRELARHVAFRTYPFRLLQCGGPTIIEAVARLAAVRREMEARR